MLVRGEFREDLYYRLKVIEVTVPPLRERRNEIRRLADFFMDRYAGRYNRPVRELSPELHERFLAYEWPGNIRELENMMKRLVILQDEQLVIREITRTPADAYAVATAAAPQGSIVESAELALDDRPPPDEPVAPAFRLADVAKAAALKAERTAIEEMLQRVHWNRRKAADQLGVSYKTLLNKIKECGISRK